MTQNKSSLFDLHRVGEWVVRNSDFEFADDAALIRHHRRSKNTPRQA